MVIFIYGYIHMLSIGYTRAGRDCTGRHEGHCRTLKTPQDPQDPTGPSRPPKTTQVIHRQPSIASYPQVAPLWFISAPLWGIMHHKEA